MPCCRTSFLTSCSFHNDDSEEGFQGGEDGRAEADELVEGRGEERSGEEFAKKGLLLLFFFFQVTRYSLLVVQSILVFFWGSFPGIVGSHSADNNKEQYQRFPSYALFPTSCSFHSCILQAFHSSYHCVRQCEGPRRTDTLTFK